MKAAAVVVGVAACLVALLALAAGLLFVSKSPGLGGLLLGIGVVSMEGGVHLVRHAKDPKVLAFSSPVVSGAIALGSLGVAGYAANLGLARSPLDEPAWLVWALYASAALFGWIAVRAGWHAISSARKGRSA